MAVLKNRAKMSTSTTGTGTITLGSAESGYQSFADAGVANADVVRYVIEDGNNWEIGTGTYTATGTTLSRTVSESSNADAAINLSGSATVFIGATAEDIPDLYADNAVNATTPVASGTNAVAIGTGATATQSNAFSMGSTAHATNTLALSLGTNSSASGFQATAINGATASSDRSTAIGYNSNGQSAQTVTGHGAMALGGSYASGTDSFAAAIANNTSSYGATGANSVAIGYQAKATSADSIAIGEVAQSTGARAYALGRNAAASGVGSYCIGDDTAASQLYAMAYGKKAKSDVQGKHAFGTFTVESSGNIQSGLHVLYVNTTDATATALSTSNSAASTTNQVILPNNSAYSFSGTIVAREKATAGSDYASWEIKGALLRDANAASTVLGNGIQNKLYATSGASAWAIALSADTTNGGLKIEVTGAAATNIRWVATVNTSEVTYA